MVHRVLFHLCKSLPEAAEAKIHTSDQADETENQNPLPQKQKLVLYEVGLARWLTLPGNRTATGRRFM